MDSPRSPQSTLLHSINLTPLNWRIQSRANPTQVRFDIYSQRGFYGNCPRISGRHAR